MAHPAYLREKARTLRVERRLSIDEIAERLALPKTTIFYWVRDLPLGRARRENGRPGTRSMQWKYRLLREEAYRDGRRTFAALAADATFRDFVCMYIGEGYKRNRNTVSICNSDPRVVALSAHWIARLSRSRLSFCLQYHADQNLIALCSFWAGRLGAEPSEIRTQRKSNSGRLSGRTWRSKYGVLSVTVHDTMLRARLQAWMDCLQEQWVDSPEPGRSSAW